MIGHFTRRSTLLLVGFWFFSARFTAADSTPPIHPSALKHLELAGQAIQQKRYPKAMAHAELLLLAKPIFVFFHSANLTKEQKEVCAQALLRGTKLWQSALQYPISFLWVNDPSQADVFISYVQNLQVAGHEASGHAKWSRSVFGSADGDFDYDLKAEIKLRLFDPEGKLFSLSAMTHTVAHEFGHLLGLDDINEQGYIMGPLYPPSPVRSLHPAEVESLRSLRSIAHGIRQKAAFALL